MYFDPSRYEARPGKLSEGFRLSTYIADRCAQDEDKASPMPAQRQQRIEHKGSRVEPLTRVAATIQHVVDYAVFTNTFF